MDHVGHIQVWIIADIRIFKKAAKCLGLDIFVIFVIATSQCRSETNHIHF